ncbi:MAG: cell envelope integrity protein CreD [Gammaproteobacteria bacterium]|nr:cell envelope integrity protein CreD [Gammaproteobacteria bacterium]
MFKIEPISLRFVLVIGIIVALMIPLLFVLLLVQERKMYHDQALADVAQSWGSNQAIIGPLVTLRLRDENSTSNRVVNKSDEWVQMPHTLDLTLESTHDMRKRGIYHIPVFTASLKVHAEFLPLDREQLEGEIDQVFMTVGISDSRGIRKLVITWDGMELDDLVSTHLRGIGSVVQVELAADDLQEISTVTIEADLRGTDRFSMLPVGDATEVSMTSDWPDPSFDGRFLPDERRVDADGFSANWSTHALSRGFPSLVNVDDLERVLHNIEMGSAQPIDLGFTILNLNTPYRATERSIKYGALFIVMTMIGIVCVEMVSRASFHIIQYGVVGAGLVLFFLTLLSLSEHVGFSTGYFLAAFLLATMNVGYLWFVSRKASVAIAMASVLSILYVALYFVLQLNEYALLVGTILLLILLGSVMYATRSLSRGGVHPSGTSVDSVS